MPVTPLHIGIPGLISYYFPKKMDIFGAILGCTLLDIDFFLFLGFGTPVHGFLHSFLGATVLAIILILIIKLFQPLVVIIKKWFKWDIESSLGSIAIGAFVGTYSHVLLDSLIYTDMNPLYPLDGNPLYIESFQPMFTTFIYGITGITTIILIMVYSSGYLRAMEEESDKN